MTIDPKNSVKEITTKNVKLQEEAWQISQILFEAQESLKIIEYMLTKSQELDSYIVMLNSYWRFSTSIHTDHILLKLNILFTKKEHFSIPRFLDKLRPGSEFGNIVTEARINVWKGEVKKLGISIKKILIQRNKRIAHKDRAGHKKLTEEITLGELKGIIKLVQGILKEIYQVTIQSSFQVESHIGSPVDSLNEIMMCLNEDRRNYLSPLFDEAIAAGLTDDLPKDMQ